MSYTPSQETLEKYANVLVNLALGSGAGVKPGEVVRVTAQEIAKPLYLEVCKAVWRAGGSVIEDYHIDEVDQTGTAFAMYESANTDAQFDFFPAKFTRGLVDDIDHLLMIISDTDLHALENVDAKRMMQRGKARQPWMRWRAEKEGAGKLTWTLGLYTTAAMAAEAGLSEQDYWEQIIKACFLDDHDPIGRWRAVEKQIKETMKRLNALAIKKLHIEGADADLWVTIGEKRQWMGGSGRNIPSFEVFTSPDWRGTNGWIRFNQPLYNYGVVAKNVRLEFKDGVVVNVTADTGEKMLQEMVATENANKIGEYSLTDSRLSRITKFMATTLYDENMGGRYGNTHLALGSSYHDTYDGDPNKVSDEEWERLGFNESSVHTDIISTTDRTVTAVLEDGSERVIYEDGKFTV